MIRIQESFSTLFGKDPAGEFVESTQAGLIYATNASAKAARDERHRVLRSMGFKPRRMVLRNQLREWWAMGIPCGRSCDVYMLEYEAEPYAKEAI